MSEGQAQKTGRRLGAILFADVAGYSRLMGHAEDETHNAVMDRVRHFQRRAPEYRGEILNVAGDNLLAFFDSVASAVDFAVAIQKENQQRNSDADQARRIDFRIGINLGDVIEEAGNIYGDCVNIASRLEGLAEPGGICISRAVYEQIKQQAEIGFQYLGPQELKNIVDPVEVFRLHEEKASGLHAATRRDLLADPLFEKHLPSRPSVAVLPFKYLGGDHSEDFLADGLTEDITTNLSRFHGMFVIARASAFIYKDKSLPVQRICQELGVRYLVQGSVRQSGKRVRITIYLLDALEGQTLWAENFDREFGDIFEVQDEITEAAVATMSVRIEEAERERFRQLLPTDMEAYGLLLQGQQRIFRYKREDNVTARRLYEAALQNDPRYARAVAAISRTYNLDWRYAWAQAPDQSLDKALDLARTAIDLDPSDARGYAELGYVRLYRKEHDLSIASYERALSLNPNDADIINNMADALAHSGRSEEAVPLFNKAIRLNPFYPDQYLWDLGGAYYNLSEYEEAIRVVSRMNNPTEGHRLLAASYAQLDRMNEARHHAGKVLEAHPNFSIERWKLVLPDKHPDETEHFLEGLKKAGL